MLWQENKYVIQQQKKCNFEIVLFTGKQKDFLKITINMRRSFIDWQLVSSYLALNKKSKK